MEFEYKKEFRNLQYGKCYLIDEKGNHYLVYADKCFNHYIVCNYIDDMGTMMNQEFFETLDDAIKYFNDK
jgi:hypothetical protein